MQDIVEREEPLSDYGSCDEGGPGSNSSSCRNDAMDMEWMGKEFQQEFQKQLDAPILKLEAHTQSLALQLEAVREKMEVLSAAASPGKQDEATQTEASEQAPPTKRRRTRSECARAHQGSGATFYAHAVLPIFP